MYRIRIRICIGYVFYPVYIWLIRIVAEKMFGIFRGPCAKFCDNHSFIVILLTNKLTQYTNQLTPVKT